MNNSFYVISKAVGTKPREWAVCQCGLLMLASEKKQTWQDENGNPIGTSFSRPTAENIAHSLQLMDSTGHFCVCHISNNTISIDSEI